MRRAWLLVGFALVSCGGVARTMREASPNQPCPDLLARHDAIARDPSYATQPVDERERYEVLVARCDLAMHRADAALDLAKRWSDANRFERNRIAARAEAALGHDDAARTALESLRDDTHVDVGYLLYAPELRRYADQDWFVALALHLWQQRRTMSITELADALAQHAGRTLLSLAVASAERARQPGDWALWTGVVRTARIDREKDETILIVEGVDVKRELAAIDRKVESVETTRKLAPLAPPTYESTPKYRTDRVYHEAFVPNGRMFVVRYPRASERIVDLQTIVAFGRYRGRDEERPLLDALAISPRQAEETHESD